ncbi:hypothetical protein FPSE_02147 [Fusarium pseudograminearum CS3096]|uniref:Uncharacterized protein n=1 Tax=Fusarium pseudograminearum (strain CS3096) TaxID=1028729 RepID=K3VR76_FUSPC|nr:hypothetical protein FPSE_02147 [Fusarium pseudograminearum CS3096]EKJ77649.1 hypothetical protein FPSE_02147 [Fusarium pseudograminearum CS3096]
MSEHHYPLVEPNYRTDEARHDREEQDQEWHTDFHDWANRAQNEFSQAVSTYLKGSTRKALRYKPSKPRLSKPC